MFSIVIAQPQPIATLTIQLRLRRWPDVVSRSRQHIHLLVVGGQRPGVHLLRQHLRPDGRLPEHMRHVCHLFAAAGRCATIAAVVISVFGDVQRAPSSATKRCGTADWPPNAVGLV